MSSMSSTNAPRHGAPNAILHSQIPAITGAIDDAEHDVDHIEQLRVRQAVVLPREVAESNKSPIHRLPPEILQSIFLFTSKFKPSCFGLADIWNLPSLDISAVCKHWRDIAIAYPSLWTDMMIDLDRDAPVLALVQLYLLRSQKEPLSFMAEGSDNTHPGRELLESLLHESHRWLSVDLQAVEDLKDLVMDQYIDLPALRSATFHQESFFQLEAFNSAQKLESIRTRTFPFFIPTQVRIDSNLRHLTVEHENMHWLRSLLVKLPELQKLESVEYCGTPISEYYSDYGHAAEYAEVMYPLAPVTSHISSFLFRLWDYDGIYPLLKDIFSSLVPPSLVELKIQGRCRVSFEEVGRRDKAFSGEWPRATIHNLITTSSCHLTTLVLSGMPISDVDVIAMLYITPDLVDFTLHELWAEVRPELYSDEEVGARPDTLNVKTVTKWMMEQLRNPALDGDAFTEQRYALVPKLRKLSLRVLHANWEADEEFMKMVRSRWLRPLHRISENDSLLQAAQLRTVELTVLGVFLPDEVVYKPLKRLEREGLMFTIRTGRLGCDEEYFVI